MAVSDGDGGAEDFGGRPGIGSDERRTSLGKGFRKGVMEWFYKEGFYIKNHDRMVLELLLTLIGNPSPPPVHPMWMHQTRCESEPTHHRACNVLPRPTAKTSIIYNVPTKLAPYIRLLRSSARPSPAPAIYLRRGARPEHNRAKTFYAVAM